MVFPDTFKQVARRVRGLSRDSNAQTQQDYVLAKRLYATFERELELAEIHGLKFYVRSGTVTVYGTTQNSLDVDLIVSLVRQVPGVKGVKTSLQVIQPWFLESAAGTGD